MSEDIEATARVPISPEMAARFADPDEGPELLAAVEREIAENLAAAYQHMLDRYIAELRDGTPCATPPRGILS
jgi:hypothetical protein